ncbi:putative NAD dependent epimerase/dehydratase [Xylariaceae sp. FL0016]|nr:putative NAD dependent epimerase/dehydratase [Xylariaceae sp. FL0016]
MAASKQRLFMTGGSGYIGSRIVTFALAEGYEVRSLSRSAANDAKIRALGGVPVRGDLHAVDVLRAEAAAADVVINLADAWMQHRDDYGKVVEIDRAAVQAMAAGLRGTEKPLIITSGTALAKPDPEGGETDENAEEVENPLNGRWRCEGNGLALAEQGVRVCAVRLAPYVYGRGGSGVRLFMGMFAKMGEVCYIGDGAVQTSVVHVDDAARLYLLVAKHGKKGEIYNGVSNTEVSVKEMSAAEAEVLGVPLVSRTKEEVEARGGPILAAFLGSGNRASGAKARRQLSWVPREAGILEDISTGSYAEVAKDFRQGAIDSHSGYENHFTMK